jgi:DHA2 family multidrug resistance protein
LTLSFVRSPKYGEKLKSNQVDWLGIILLASFIGSLQFVLEHGQQDDWFNNKLIVLLSAVSVFGVILFIWRQLTYKYPSKFKRSERWKFKDWYSYGFYSRFWIVRIYINNTHIYAIHFGLTATDAGLLLIPGSITTAFMMPIGKLIQRSAARVHDWCWVLVFFIYL